MAQRLVVASYFRETRKIAIVSYSEILSTYIGLILHVTFTLDDSRLTLRYLAIEQDVKYFNKNLKHWQKRMMISFVSDEE